MDDSQSSDFLSESTDIFCNSPTADSTMVDIGTYDYETLVTNTKSAFQRIRKVIMKSNFSENFSSLLEDCSSCISQSLNLITKLLSETHLNLNKLKQYMSDAAALLQLLSDFVKNIIEAMSMTCLSMKTFPTVTGRIVMLVFTHCKDSELVYGDQLNSVETYIKDLFRSCHELQLTYLMVLEKHYIFNLTESEELDILLEVLDINLKIGEIVQSLDVKTMAEQWKAYTLICEKYSSNLTDKSVFSNSTKVLCTMITNNIERALELNQEEKVVLRSLKVSSFTLKILLRVCITFKHAVDKDYHSIMELLLYVNLNNEAYLQTIGGKCSQFINIYNNNVSLPLYTLLGELLYDNKLLQCICNYDVHHIRRDDKLLGLILLVISTIKTLVQKGGDQLAKLQKHRLNNVVYGFLPHCHIWFNMGLKFKCEVSTNYESYSLYEHLLTHTLVLSSIMINEEINILEKRMIEALLSIDCVSALFTANLWTLLARKSSKQLNLSQLVSLSKIYQKLENNSSFDNSPQKVHLGHTIGRLFEIMCNEDKKKMYSMFNVCDERNISLWSYLKIRNLPNDVRCQAEEKAIEMFQTHMQALISHEHYDIHFLINSIILVSTCTHMHRDPELESLVIEGWSNACRNNRTQINQLHRGTMLFYKYIQALVQLTESMRHMFKNNVYIVKILHVISTIIQEGCVELNLLVLNILCKFANIETNDLNTQTRGMLTKTFGTLFENTEPVVRNKLYSTLRRCYNNNLYRIVSNVVNKDESLKQAWSHFVKHGELRRINETTLKKQLQYTMDLEYCHKCVLQSDDLGHSGSVSLEKSLSNNFDLVDIDSLFEPECDSEPACKKAKLNNSEIECIISRLEDDASILSRRKENISNLEYKNRIKAVCNKLANILG